MNSDDAIKKKDDERLNTDSKIAPKSTHETSHNSLLANIPDSTLEGDILKEDN